MMKFLPAIPPLLLAIATMLAPPLRAWLGQHPDAMTYLGTAYAILSLLHPSPVADDTEKK